uniref:CCHC-type domain-containing protein n=1 Tax=Cajanus cajan TaxID=3821 RepID=A0A151S163_CAJCA|nr:hypothetical protein KK1_029784 [Cajanus cajan]
MAGRPGNTTAELLAWMTQVLESLVQDRDVEPLEYRGLYAFTRHNLPRFEGNFDLEGAQRWILKIKRIFNALGCREEHKVIYATYILSGEAEDWWMFTNWEVFKESFLGNYFSRDLRKQKAREFLDLKQGNMTIKPCTYCGKMGHVAKNCWFAPLKTGSNQGGAKPEPRINNGAKPKILGKVFAMSGLEVVGSNDLIRGKFIINNRVVDVLYDFGATHSFISLDCVRGLELLISSLPYEIIVSTPSNKPIITSNVCLNCSVMVHRRMFPIDLICLPLSNLDVVLGMDWLSSNHVFLDCNAKTLIFGDSAQDNSRLFECE